MLKGVLSLFTVVPKIPLNIFVLNQKYRRDRFSVFFHLNPLFHNMFCISQHLRLLSCAQSRHHFRWGSSGGGGAPGGIITVRNILLGQTKIRCIFSYVFKIRSKGRCQKSCQTRSACPPHHFDHYESLLCFPGFGRSRGWTEREVNVCRHALLLSKHTHSRVWGVNRRLLILHFPTILCRVSLPAFLPAPSPLLASVRQLRYF